MRSSVFLTVFILTVYTNAEFKDKIGKASVKIFENVALESNGHLVISPFSIWNIVLTVSFLSSGECRRQIIKAVDLPDYKKSFAKKYFKFTTTVMKPNEDVVFFMKNFMFIDKSLKITKKFAERMNSSLPYTVVKMLDFSSSNVSALQANSIIRDSGSNVSDVLSVDNFENSRMILTNVISFKGLWASPFNETDTVIEPFYDENKTEIGKVKMMYQRYQFPFSSMKSMGAWVLELPYGNDKRYCMLVVLPQPSNTVQQVSESFQTVTFKDIFAQLQSDEDEFGLVDIDVKLPRFKISTNVVLNKPLNSMGVYDIFDPGRASFEKITTEEIYISAIVHKADIEVTESGTVASAATSAYFADRIATPNFSANRPFMYFVMEKPTATVIFSGIYSKPSVF